VIASACVVPVDGSTDPRGSRRRDCSTPGWRAESARSELFARDEHLMRVVCASKRMSVTAPLQHVARQREAEPLIDAERSSQLVGDVAVRDDSFVCPYMRVGRGGQPGTYRPRHLSLAL
jgi:hypothetical protein